MALARSAFAALIAASLAPVSAQTAAAQTYPTHPIRIIVSSAAGGPLDVVGRAVAEKMSAALKQPVVVEARSGAGGNIAADFVSKSAPDGYTLLFTLSTTLTVNPHLYKDLSFNLKPITVVNYSTQTLFVHPSVPVNTVTEFVAWARKEGPVSYAHGGNGTSSHLVMEYFGLLAGFQTVGVPYRGGAPAVLAVVTGDAQFSALSGQVSLPQIHAGAIRALAVGGVQRHPALPDAPTVAESGYPGFEAVQWVGMLAPPGTPKPIVARLHAVLTQALKNPDVAARFTSQGMTPVVSTPQEFQATIEAEVKQWREVAEAAKIKPE